MELLDTYTEPLRSFMSTDLKTTRISLGLSQLKMAELLDIDLRSYANLEHGKSLCSTRVFLQYVFQCKSENQTQFMEQIKQVMNTTKAESFYL